MGVWTVSTSTYSHPQNKISINDPVVQWIKIEAAGWYDPYKYITTVYCDVSMFNTFDNVHFKFYYDNGDSDTLTVFQTGKRYWFSLQLTLFSPLTF